MLSHEGPGRAPMHTRAVQSPLDTQYARLLLNSRRLQQLRQQSADITLVLKEQLSQLIMN